MDLRIRKALVRFKWLMRSNVVNNLCSKYAINRDRTTLVPPLNAGTLPVSQLLQAATFGIFKVNRYLYARWNVPEIVGVGGPA